MKKSGQLEAVKLFPRLVSNGLGKGALPGATLPDCRLWMTSGINFLNDAVKEVSRVMSKGS